MARSGIGKRCIYTHRWEWVQPGAYSSPCSLTFQVGQPFNRLSLPTIRSLHLRVIYKDQTVYVSLYSGICHHSPTPRPCGRIEGSAQTESTSIVGRSTDLDLTHSHPQPYFYIMSLATMPLTATCFAGLLLDHRDLWGR